MSKIWKKTTDEIERKKGFEKKSFFGAMTISITTFSITTLSIWLIWDTQYNETQHYGLYGTLGMTTFSITTLSIMAYLGHSAYRY
jgi:magnesium-transporting ATPase (P-type)